MAQTPNPSRRSWVGPAPMPFLTPRPERRHLEMRWDNGGSRSAARRSGVGAVAGNGGRGGRSEMDREVNVQVVLRCRPLSEDEQRANVQSVISCNDQKREEVTVLHSLFKEADKKFTFDKVFGPKSQQRSIYDHAVAPMVTFLELYNEDITDLLASEDRSKFAEDRHKRHITLMEDGKGSRSHAVFSINIHVKETVGNEELMKFGRLNLVDLAGSENIARSGVKEAMREKLEHLELSLEKQNKEVEKFRGLYLEEQECRLNFEFQNKDLNSTDQLEKRIAQAKDIYVSGVQCMKELANTLRQRSVMDSEQMRLNISTHAIAIDNFLAMMVSEAEQVLDDILKSTSELKELLAFSSKLQHAGLKRSLASAQGISKTSIDFFKDIRIHVSRLIKITEQNQIQRSSKLLEFENEFKEICVNDEQAALDKIAAILSGLTAKKTTMVSTYVGQLNEIYSEEQKHMNLEMSNLQQVSDNGKDESVAYVGEVESRFQEDMSLHARLNGQMEGILEQCLKNGEHSVSYWSHTQSSLHDLCSVVDSQMRNYRREEDDQLFRYQLKREGRGKYKMQSSGKGQGFVGQDHVLSTSDTEGRRVLEEELSWARLERQRVLTLSAEADEAIWSLAELARRTMQERDEARNQARMLLSELHARNAQMMMLPVTPSPRVPIVRPDAFAATGYSPLCRMAMQGQHYAQTTGTAGHCVASSSGFGHMSLASSSLHGFASSSQEDHFDPDMFLVDVDESPQHVVSATAGSSNGGSSGTNGQVAEHEQKPFQLRGKSAQAAVLRGTAGHGHAS
nr:unnamed protein product [Digitaria exilis]